MKRFLLFIVTIAMLGVGCSGKDGSTGPMGPQGPQGPIGPTGPTGPPGASAKTVYFTDGVIPTDDAMSYLIQDIVIGTNTPNVMAYISFEGVASWMALPVYFPSKGAESTFTIENGKITFFNCGNFYGMVIVIE